MRYFVFSDVHGVAQALEKTLERFEKEQADVMLVLGDLIYHGPRNGVPDGYDPIRCVDLLNRYKDRIVAVRGNCDADVDQMMMEFAITAKYMILPTEWGFRMVLTHGHHPEEEFYIQPGDLLISGHTHVLKAEKKHNYYWLNPGSIALPKEGNPGTYAVIEGRQIEIKDLEGNIVKTFDF